MKILKQKIEYLDVVNLKDEVAGQASYSDIYHKKLTHRIIHILIFNARREMLLQKRSHNKSFLPLYWSTAVGGHVRSGESYREAAKRELQEELGVELDIVRRYEDLYVDKEYEIGLQKHLQTFIAKSDGPFKINCEEVEQVAFFSLPQIQKMLKNRVNFHPELLYILRNHYQLE